MIQKNCVSGNGSIFRYGKRPRQALLEANFSAVKAQVPCDQVAQLEVNLKPSGKDLRGPCPLPGHQGNSPSFYCYPNEGGVFDSWYCHRCNEGGDVIDLYGKMNGLDHNPVSALNALANEVGMQLWREEDFLTDGERQMVRAEKRAEKNIERVFTERIFERDVMPVILSIEDPAQRKRELQKALKTAGLDR